MANAGQKLVTAGGMDLVRQGAEILYKNYSETFARWGEAEDDQVGHPVMIAVVNNKLNARALFEMLGGRRNRIGNPGDERLSPLLEYSTPWQFG